MTIREAGDRAAKLGLKVWMMQASMIGGDDEVMIKCVGFEDINVSMGQAETWDEALNRAIHLIYSA